MKMNGISNNGNASTWVQRHISPALTQALHHLLGLPSRKALAGSIREQTFKLSSEQKTTLVSLLKKHNLIQPQFAHLTPEQLEHFHFSKTITESRSSEFIADFNSQFEGIVKISPSAGQFSIITTDEISLLPEELKEGEPSARSIIIGILNVTNRPLNLSQIKGELKTFCQEIGIKPAPEEISIKNLSYEIGGLAERGTLVTTFAMQKDARRFFMRYRLNEVLHRTIFNYENETGEIEYIYQKEAKNLVKKGLAKKITGKDGNPAFMADSLFNEALNRTVFLYENEEGEEVYIHQKAAEDLVEKGKACKFMTLNGTYIYLSVDRFAEEITVEVKTKGKSFRIFCNNIRKLKEQGLVLEGLEDETFISCYIHPDATLQHPFEIFNAFALAYLDSKDKDFEKNYKQLRAAFSAGLRHEKTTSIPDFLYEAKTLADMKAGLISIAIALIKRPKAAVQLEEAGLFQDQIKEIKDSFPRLSFISRFPLLFAPEMPDSIQNFMDFIYDITKTYDIFLLLLITKLSQLRKFSATQESFPASLQREIELIYAPLAESKGLIDLANNMRDLVTRLVDPDGYAAARNKMEEELGMDFNQARRHLTHIANTLREDLETDPDYNPNGNGGLSIIEVRTRIKEIASFMGKRGLEDVLDNCGVRWICETVNDAYVIAGFLQHRLDRLSDKALPGNRKAIEDYLRRPNKNGWMGWSGYFYEPLGEKDGNDHISDRKDRRVLSIQILTKEMDNKDKLGKAAHWSYKAERAAKAYAESLEKKYKRQVFDSAPIDEYTGDPQHDYYVDQRRARKYIRAFVLISKESFSANSFVFPKDGGLPILRLQDGDVVADAIAFRGFGDILTRGYHAKLYKFYLDGIRGKFMPRPYYKGDGSVPSDRRVPNTSLLVVEVGDKELAPISFREARGSVRKTNLRAVLLTHPRYLRNREALITEGMCSSSEELLDTDEKKQKIIDFFKLKDINEVWMVIALGLIDEISIRAALED